MNPNLSSDSRSSLSASVWNLLSQRYKEALIGRKGSKSMVTFFFFSVVGDDGSGVENEAVWRDFVVEFEALLGGGDCA